MRIGIGYDLHRLVDGRPLVMGGVSIPHEKGLKGHSDADVLLHAIADAVLGAAALGDLGAHFPDTEEEWKGADSMDLLRSVGAAVRDEGYVLQNVDATVVLERPKLRPHIDAMRENVATALDLELDRVSVKATTGEGVGPEGRENAATAHAVCLLDSK